MKPSKWKWTPLHLRLTGLYTLGHTSRQTDGRKVQPDRPFHNFRASKSGDRQKKLCSLVGAPCDAFGSYKTVKGWVGKSNNFFLACSYNSTACLNCKAVQKSIFSLLKYKEHDLLKPAWLSKEILRANIDLRKVIAKNKSRLCWNHCG